MRGGVQSAASLGTGTGAREGSQAAALAKVRGALLRRLRAREEEIVDAIFARVSSMFKAAQSGEDVDYATGLRETVAAVVNLSLSEIEDPSAQVAPVPSAAIAQAHRAARRNVSVETMLLRYIAGHRVLGGFVLDEAHRSGLASNGPALRHLRTTQEALLERLMTRIADEYRRERVRVERSREECQVELVHKLLAGERPDTTDLEYDLDDAWHLGVIASGVGCRRAVRGLADDLGRQLLCVSAGEGSDWAWIGGRQELDMGRVEHALSASRTAGVTLVLGEPRKGLAGWRLTHREALAVLVVAQRKPEFTVRFADHALLALVLQNESLVRSLAGIYLPALGNAVGRETVRAYFSAGCNAATAAAQLAIDRHTVERRLRTIESNLGRQLRSCHAELEVVLRLDELGVTLGVDADEGTAS